MANESLEFGADYFGAEYTDNLSCPNQDCNRSGFFGYKDKYFSLEYICSTVIGLMASSKPNKPYIAVSECPNCSTKFWYHVSEIFAEEIHFERSKKK